MTLLVTSVVAILSSGLSQAESSPTFCTRFAQRTTTGAAEEDIRGTVYFQSPEKATIVIDYPLNQFMIIEDRVLTLYYPDSQEAFRFTEDQPIQIPFVEPIIRSLKEGYGLIELGYQLADYKKKDEHLFTYWSPPAAKQDVPGEVILEILTERVVSIEVRAPEGETIIRSTFDNHIQFDGKQIPLEATSVFLDGVEQLRKEHIAYQNLQFGTEFPNWVVNFQISESVHIEESK